MDNFLNELYYERVKSIEKEKRYRLLSDFPSENETIRNDQKISDTSKQTELIDKLISSYLQLNGFRKGE